LSKFRGRKGPNLWQDVHLQGYNLFKREDFYGL